MISPIGRRPNRPGFTLIELILSSVIIAVLVGVATPLFRKTFTDLELKNMCFNVSKLIGYAQEKAVLENTQYKLVIDKEGAKYYIVKSDPSAPGGQRRLEERYGRTFLLPRGYELKSDKAQIVFYPDGHSDKAAIYFSGKNKSIGLKVKGNLGYVDIEENK